MKKLILSLAVMALFSAGCQKPELESPFGNDLSFVASIEAFSSQTKTAMNSDRQVLWTADDRVAIFQGSTLADEYAIDESCAGKSHATLNPIDGEGGTSANKEFSSNVAFYPYADALSLTVHETTYEVNGYSLPSVQHYAANSFVNGSFPMVAVTKNITDKNFSFKNVLGAMKLQLKGTQVVKSIKVEGANREKLSGAATVTAYAGNLTPAITMTGTDEASKSVILDCGDGVQLNTASATDFIIALPPVLFANGFTVTVIDTNSDSYTISAKVSNTVLRSSILLMPEVLLESDDEDSGDDVDVLNDYIDEYGVNHGKGVKIGKTVWAPVNCGYHATDYQWGKLYQWGRKYGQGYDGDATTPELSEGGVSLQGGQSENNKNVFYTCPDYPEDWLYSQNDALWNSGTEDSPVKTEYDPCPTGWRVPTYAELEELYRNRSSWTENDLGQSGYWFSGPSSYSSEAAQVFFPAAGCRNYNLGNALNRGDCGYYWSSMPLNDYGYDYGACVLRFYGGYAFVYDYDRADGYSVRCVQNASGEPLPNDENENLDIPVLSVSLNSTSLKLYEGGSAQLEAKVRPVDATYKSIIWSSSDATVAAVDQTGFVSAISAGTAEISAQVGGLVATCSVEVKQKLVAKDYVDEYGINHGKGVAVGMAIWAPVNCGYHATDYKWGKLYQWGRKYGQGYDGDATTPELSEGGVSLQGGQSSNNENVFFIGLYDWLYQTDDQLWNSGTEDSPVKTEYDPCPTGWRVPTDAELRELYRNRSSWTENDLGQSGYWFSGPSSYSSEAAQVFFPDAGYRYYYDGDARDRGYYGSYWSSRPGSGSAYALYFNSGDADMYYGDRARGYSVRCVQD